VVTEQKDKLTCLQKDKTELGQVLSETRMQLQQCSLQKGRPHLRYSDLYAGCLLEKYVHAFTFFDTIGQNDALLDLWNYADGSVGSFPVGDGMYTKLRAYSHVKMSKRL